MQRLARLFAVDDLAGRLQQLLDYLLVGQHPLQVVAHRLGKDLRELCGPHRVGPAVELHLLGN